MRASGSTTQAAPERLELKDLDTGVADLAVRQDRSFISTVPGVGAAGLAAHTTCPTRYAGPPAMVGSVVNRDSGTFDTVYSRHEFAVYGMGAYRHLEPDHFYSVCGSRRQTREMPS